MKRITCLLLIIVLGELSLSAQQKKIPPSQKKTPAQEKKTPAQPKQKGIDLQKFTMDFSLEGGLPILNMKGSSIGPGGAYHLDYIINEKIAVSGSIGYNRFLAKGKKGSAANYQYEFLGASYFVQPSVHIDAFLGYALFKGTFTIPFGGSHSFNNKGPAFAAGAGYKVNKIFDVSLRFQKSKTVSFIGLSLAFRFDQ